jgi:transcriptional regulator with XRE-family HTH domain
MSFGDRLRQERQLRGFTQEQLAEALGVSPRTISRWEQGLALPRYYTQRQLGRLLGREPEEFFPGFDQQESLSPLWTVPFPRNPGFTGREEILHVLHTRLTTQLPTPISQATALCGLGGIGKTQVAIEYAHRYAQEYHAVFWLAAETSESLMASLQQIAEQLQLSERQAAKQTQMVMAVQRWLATHSQWLLIADNVDDLDLLQRVLPPQRRGVLLLTTRRQALGPQVEPLELPTMSSEEGATFLLRRARQPDVSGSDLPQGARPFAPAITELGELLGGLPLALDQAGAYIEETGCSVVEYLERYHHQRKNVLGRRGIHGCAHPDSVMTTLSLAIQRIAREHPAAADLLYACSFLDPEDISEKLLVEGASHLGPRLGPVLDDAYQFDFIMAALRSASLVTRCPQTHTFAVHRLVQAVLQDQMEPAERRLWSERVLRMINATSPERNFDIRPQCEQLLGQALA